MIRGDFCFFLTALVFFYSEIKSLLKRLEKREKRSQDPATCAFFQILGNGASGGPKSIFMFTDYNRYLFNCGEATQKIFCDMFYTLLNYFSISFILS